MLIRSKVISFPSSSSSSGFSYSEREREREIAQQQQQKSASNLYLYVCCFPNRIKSKQQMRKKQISKDSDCWWSFLIMIDFGNQ